MKQFLKTLVITLVMANTYFAPAQNNSVKKNYFQLSPRIGYDFPTFNNNTPYIDYKGELELGISLDYYWKWFGLGIDYDYIKNKPKSTYPTINLYDTGGMLISDFALSEGKITRTFLGIGPSFKHSSNSNRFTTELNARIGISSIKGGRTLLTDVRNSQDLNFHAGYDDKEVLSFKGQVRLNYFFSQTKNFGVHIGAYYIKHFGVTELSEGGRSAFYFPLINTLQGEGQVLDDNLGEQQRLESCDCDISSIGIFAGITLRFPKKPKICPVCETEHTPFCCATCGCNVTVTAKDKFTGKTLPNTDIVLTDLNGNIVQSATTNSYGVVVFNEVPENNYLIKGKLYNVALEEGSIAVAEFKNCKKENVGIQKVIEYGDENFILKGNTVECNTPTGIKGVDIILKDKIRAGQKNTLSDANGYFIFHLKQSSVFGLNGRKDGYFSNEVEVSTNTYNRNNTLFINFEMCIDPCGVAIKLENINFDLDKSIILPAAKPDLDYIVKLMQDNPSITVEMSSHTDSQGSDAYNQNLSQRRANATVNYIVSKGISRGRLIARGAGESELKNTKCANNVPCTDNEHRINRRTEFKVVCF